MRDLEEFLPEVYKTEYIKAVLKAIQKVWEIYFDDLIESRKEYCVSSATYSLPWWSDMLGVDYNDNYSYELSRSIILAKMKGNKPLSEKVLKSVVESYANATCEIEQDFPHYRFKVRIVDKVGKPEKASEIVKTVNELKPAHLDWELIFRYRTWAEWKALGKPYSYYKEKGYTWKDIRERGNL